jgi:8-oxo-dGTP pyrophosphatase MutT (NUDIX family)
MSRFSKKFHSINPWKIISATETYNNRWISVYHEDVITPGGSKGVYGAIHFKNHAIGILPLDEQNNTWLVGQYRYPLRRWSWEIPEGGCPLNTDPLESAKRELKEETGLNARSWKVLLEMDISNCVSDEISYIYLAEGITIGQAKPDESEELEVIKLPVQEAIQMVHDGEIRDSMSVAALLKIATMLK